MLVTLRTLRWPTVFLTAVFLLGGSFPLMQHACAEALHHLGLFACCDEPAAGHQAGHQADPAPCHQGDAPAPMADCCVVEAPQGVLAKVDAPAPSPKRLLAVLPALSVTLPSGTHAGLTPFAFAADTGPPGPPVSLHLLHAVFLI